MASQIQSFLIIQTAFIGDVILATALVQKLRKSHPQAQIDFLLRKGNENLLTGNPNIRNVIIWDKKQGKIKNLFKLISQVRSIKYDAVINVHRFFSSGLITALSGARIRVGFSKNPLSFLFTNQVRHDLDSNLHETDRNQKLIEFITDSNPELPRLFPSEKDYEKVNSYRVSDYVCLAPTSVWYTKQLPEDQWISFIDSIQSRVSKVFLLGALSDRPICERIKKQTHYQQVDNLAGQLSFLESAALMKGAIMNYVNDSAPMHLASSMNAPVAAIFCSTTPSFGFGPLSKKSFIIQTSEKLECRPCGLHGHRRCPQGHFKCANTISVQAMLACLDS